MPDQKISPLAAGAGGAAGGAGVGYISDIRQAASAGTVEQPGAGTPATIELQPISSTATTRVGSVASEAEPLLVRGTGTAVAEAGEGVGVGELGLAATIGTAAEEGAALGSIEPGAGTVIGAAVGAVVGVGVALLSDKS